MVGGFSALLGAYFVGYRGQYVKDKEKYTARFEKDEKGKWQVNDFQSNNDALSALGVFILWFGNQSFLINLI